jgi:GDPmannose 4,6-dehydratase
LPPTFYPKQLPLATDPPLPNRVALITGITGQDGLYMSSYLLLHQQQFDYHVYGIVRKNSQTLYILTWLQSMLKQAGLEPKRKLTLLYGDVTDQMFMSNAISTADPDEIYNLAAQTHVQHSFEMPRHTYDTNINGILNICTAILSLKKE